MKIWITRAWQIAALYAISYGANGLVAWLKLPVPGSMVGIALLFGLLQAKVVRLEWLEEGAKWLHSEMLLFFIPATVGIMQYAGLLRTNGLAVAVSVVGSTVLVLTCAGYAAQRAAMRKERTARDNKARHLPKGA